jgi:hypothetical protein
MIARRSALAAMILAVSVLPALAQVPPAQPDGGPGGASSTGGSSGGGMTADDENAQGVEAGREGQPRPDAQNRREGREAVRVTPGSDGRSPASGGVPNPPTTGSVPPATR